MLSDLDFWHAAQIIVKRYGDGAAIEAAMLADEFLDQGSLDGKRLWMADHAGDRGVAAGAAEEWGRRCIEAPPGS